MSQTDEKILKELDRSMAAASGGTGTEKKELMTEDLSDFSTSAMSFEDVTAIIMEQTEDLFAITGRCDRLAPEYLKFCRTLERSVDHLGSAFLTKVVLESKNIPQLKIRTLSAERLSRMVSFNIRKCSAALQEYNRDRQKFGLELYDQLLRFANVLARLRSTQQRAYDLIRYRTQPWKEYCRATSFSKEDHTKIYLEKMVSDAPFRSALSYEVRRDVVLDELAKQERKEKPALPEPATAKDAAAEKPASLPAAGNSLSGMPSPASENMPSGTISPAAENTLSGTLIPASEAVSADLSAEPLPVETPFPAVLPSPAEEPEKCPAQDDGSGGGPASCGRNYPVTWREILLIAAARGASQQEGSGDSDGICCVFTDEELQLLSKDEDFLRENPELAEDVIRCLHPPGSG